MYDQKLGLRDVKHILLVSSGKGGVGKSTVAANIAGALLLAGHRVGVLDADIYGPSQALMWGIPVNTPPRLAEDNRMLLPFLSAHGASLMSIATRVEDGQALNWKGSMVTMVLYQLIYQTQWGQLDYLVIDMPPGTGDVQIYVADKLKHAHAVVVTTPQEVSVIDARKGIDLFIKNHIPIIGVIENMSVHVCSHCGHADAIFGENGGQLIAQQYGIPLLAQLPISAGTRLWADRGTPWVLAAPEDPTAQAYQQIAQQIERSCHAAESDGQADPC